MRSLRNALWFLVGFSFIFAVGVATASTNGDSYIWYRKPNGEWARTPNPAGGTPNKNFKFKPGFVTSDEAGGPRVRTNRRLPVPTGPVIEATILEDVKVPTSSLKAAARVAVRASPYVALGLAASELIDAMTNDGITYDQQLQTYVKPAAPQEPPSYLPTSWTCNVAGSFATEALAKPGCVQRWRQSYSNYTCDNPGSWLPGTAGRYHYNLNQCRTGTGAVAGGGLTITPVCGAGLTPVHTGGGVMCLSSICPDGSAPVGGNCPAPKLPATDDDIEAAVANEPDVKQAQILSRLLSMPDVPIDLPSDTPASLTPTEASISTPPVQTVSTTTNADGSTTTTTTTRRQTVAVEGQGTTLGTASVSTTITTTTTTTTVNNTTNETTTNVTNQTNPPPPVLNPDNEPEGDEDYSFIDSSFPQVPSLYQQKYPDGIKGVWQSKWPQIQQTPFVAGIQSMFPDIGSGGSCPLWSLNFNLGPFGNFGTGDLDVPCWVWEVCGLILLTISCFEARRILFG